MSSVLVLGIETSCDETAASVVKDGRIMLSNVINSQIDIHKKFGGVVPEVASRNHTMAVIPCVDEALKVAGVALEDIGLIAVTQGAGLIGALLAGVSAAKALSYARNIPLMAVEHTKAHIAANYIAHPDLEPPFCCLIASGGHTSLLRVDSYTNASLIGSTLDDAVGEAFDKVGRRLGLEYPAGAKIDALSGSGQGGIEFMKPSHPLKKYTFSYSGLKTAVINYLHKSEQNGEKINIENVCASFTQAAIDPLVSATIEAAKEYKLNKIAVAGGVAANSYLRSEIQKKAAAKNISVFIPPINLCTDNAAMVASLGYYNLKGGLPLSGLDMNAKAYF